MSEEELAKKLLLNLEYIQRTVNDLQQTVKSCDERLASLSQSQALTQKDVGTLDRDLQLNKRVIARVQSWTEKVNPYLYSIDTVRQDLKRIEVQVNTVHTTVDQLEKDVAQSTFQDKKTEDDFVTVNKTIISLEQDVNDKLRRVAVAAKEDFVSKTDFQKAQKQMLWSILGFAVSTIAAWVLQSL